MIHASGTPPTRVLTVNNPQLAASNMAMQKASVKELSEKYWSNHKHVQLKQPKGNSIRRNTYFDITCLRIYGLKSGQSAHVHEAQHPTSLLGLEENASPSFLPIGHV